ncbi:hypothetical protein HK097_003463, partial [Rhizophlyctis rosea]
CVDDLEVGNAVGAGAAVGLAPWVHRKNTGRHYVAHAADGSVRVAFVAFVVVYMHERAHASPLLAYARPAARDGQEHLVDDRGEDTVVEKRREEDAAAELPAGRSIVERESCPQAQQGCEDERIEKDAKAPVVGMVRMGSGVPAGAAKPLSVEVHLLTLLQVYPVGFQVDAQLMLPLRSPTCDNANDDAGAGADADGHAYDGDN